eukprot:12689488-Alexandrium_andersonii.AAC.1
MSGFKKRCARPACKLHRRQDESTVSSSSLAGPKQNVEWPSSRISEKPTGSVNNQISPCSMKR